MICYIWQERKYISIDRYDEEMKIIKIWVGWLS